MGYKAAVQVLKQADELKIKVSRKCDWLNNPESWTDQQKLQTVYHQVLVLDLEYALDKKVEQDLWNIGFKNHITSLQEQSRDKKDPHRSDCQMLLTWALEAASGFYISLLQELCNSFDIDLPFRRRSSVYGQTFQNTEITESAQSSSCLYICQYCLVHLGDIARYRNQRKQAESFYKQAILVSPTSGQPYNQLALLEASRGNKLSTVFYYIRGIAVKNPFPASATNLLSTLNSAIDKDNPSKKVQTKMSVNEFIQLFLCTHGYFQSTTELKQAEFAVKSLNSIMTALVATQSFTKDMLIKITVINLYAIYHIGQNSNKIIQLTSDERRVRELVLELIAGSLCAFLVPIHTLKMDVTLLDFYALPAVKFLLNFVYSEPDILKEKAFTNRLQIWPSLVKLLNNVQKYLKGINFNKYSKLPLPEDKNLQGFLPLTPCFKHFDFREEVDSKMENVVRIKRIVNISLQLAEIDVNGNRLIIKKENNGELIFEPVCVQPDPTNDLLEAMKSFSVVDNKAVLERRNLEKKGGILKPQGSLEKSREERELLSLNSFDTSNEGSAMNAVATNKGDSVKIKRGKQNVALQSIFKKIEENNKQVKFFVEQPDKEKSVKFDGMSTPLKTQPSVQSQQANALVRTQSFNQNHPAFPLVPSMHSDYLTNLRNTSSAPLDQGPHYQYPKNEAVPLSNLGMQVMPPYQTIQHPQNNMNQKPPSSYQMNPMPQNSYHNSQMSKQYQNMPFSSSDMFNSWKRDDMPPLPNPSWWQNTNQPPQQSQNYRLDNYSLNFSSYSNNLPNYMPQSNPIAPKHDFNKPTNRGGGGDIFNSPWSSYSASFVGDDHTVGFENTNQGMSMRQAMLKEANLPGVPVGPSGSNMMRLSNPPHQDNNFLQNPTSPGYSLFNTNSWTPNLAGQLRNNTPSENTLNHLPQQSLFSGHGPKSLAQLLEHQQSQLNKNNS